MMAAPGRARAVALANIALVKYWGKRDAALNLPAAGSLSLTLDALPTTTTVAFRDDLPSDEFRLDGALAPERAAARVSTFLDLVRARAGISTRAEIASENGFPTASGLASSASAFAALAVAATAAAGLELSASELSALARRGSGSAARSIFGGFVRMRAGERDDGADATAEPIPGAADWPLRMVIAVVGGGRPKSALSTDAMQHCAQTSPLYPGWLDSVPGDLEAAEEAIRRRDVDALGQVTEQSALTMHAAAMASRPAILYFEPPTIACWHEVHALRQRGLRAYATADAGPHVKVLTDARDADETARALRAVPGVSGVMVSGVGAGAQVIGEED